MHSPTRKQNGLSSPALGEETAEASFLSGEELPGKSRSLAGWLVGALFGVMVGLLLTDWLVSGRTELSPVRDTIHAQLQLALDEESVPWARALDSQRSENEVARLDAIAAHAPKDYLMNIGSATALANYSPESGSATHPIKETYSNADRALVRLRQVTMRFPEEAGGFAHLARYMTVTHIHIQRAELEPPASPAEESRVKPSSDPTLRSIPISHADLRLMTWALRMGEQRDPENAFWPAMRAIAYFAALRDDDALRALSIASRKTHWDAYIYQQIFGQWRLYATAYGDAGATQKIGPLSLIAFPHLRELRIMAQLARWHADREAEAGHYHKALQIRRDIARLGMTIRYSAHWAYEALFGTDLFFIANTDSGATLTRTAIQNVRQWKMQASGFLAMLRAMHLQSEIPWLLDEVAANCDLRRRLDMARSDISYPGAPPGIPLARLFGYWMVGIFLIQQILNMTLAALSAKALARYLERHSHPSFIGRLIVMTLLFALTAVMGVLLYLGATSKHIAIGFLVGMTLLFLLGVHSVYRLRMGRPANPASEARQVAGRWSIGMVIYMLIVLLAPAALLLYLFLPHLASMHPVAQLLSSSLSDNLPTPLYILDQGVFECALPLAATVILSIWALRRGLSPMAGVLIGIRRMTLPAITCLVVGYLIMLTMTLRLDVSARRAIQGAAQNEFDWVLTHSSAH